MIVRSTSASLLLIALALAPVAPARAQTTRAVAEGPRIGLEFGAIAPSGGPFYDHKSHAEPGSATALRGWIPLRGPVSLSLNASWSHPTWVFLICGEGTCDTYTRRAVDLMALDVGLRLAEPILPSLPEDRGYVEITRGTLRQRSADRYDETKTYSATVPSTGLALGYLHVLDRRIALDVRVDDRMARFRYPSKWTDPSMSLTHNFMMTAGVSLAIW